MTDVEDAFETATRALLASHGDALLELARASLVHGLAHGEPLPISAEGLPADLAADGACFVTLKLDGQLRGCIGSPEARRPLAVDVAENAYASAFRDNRFKPLTTRELDGLSLSISVLSPKVEMTITDEVDLLHQLRPGMDGLIIEDGGRRALFLPSVWRQLDKPQQFLAHLKAKASIPADHFSPGFRAWRFIAEEIYLNKVEA